LIAEEKKQAERGREKKQQIEDAIKKSKHIFIIKTLTSVNSLDIERGWG
jgi:hypothetical protein